MSTQPLADPEMEALLEEEGLDAPVVGILMGSESDAEVMRAASEELAERGIGYEVRVLSAHRNPDAVREYALGAEARGHQGHHRRARARRPRCRAWWRPTRTCP